MESVAFSPDGKTLASGDWAGTIKLWNVASGRELRTLGGHIDGVDSIAFSLDGRWLASGGSDGTTRVSGTYRPARNVLRLSPSQNGSYLAVAPEGYYDAPPPQRRRRSLDVRIGDRVFPIAAYRKEFYRPELVKLSLAGESLKEHGFAGLMSTA